MQEDRRIHFPDNRIQVSFVLGSDFQGVIVKRQELGIVLPELTFSPGQYFIQFDVGVVIEIVLGNGVLNKGAGYCPFCF